MQIYHTIHNKLKTADNILIVGHVRPDGDALGSALAFYRYLNYTLRKNVKVFINDELPMDFNFLPHFNQLENRQHSLMKHRFDVVLILDCGAKERAGLESFLEKIDYQPHLINIDHHPGNDSFGHLNFVTTNISSTSEITYNLLKIVGAKIDDKIATLLLNGIITDTDFFLNQNTSHKTLKVAAELMNLGAKPNLVLQNIYNKNKSIKGLKLWGLALSRLMQDKKTGLAVTVIFENDLEDFYFDDNALEGLANFISYLNDVNGIMLLREKKGGVVKGSLRSRRDDVDVAKIAAEYGGGGHIKAAGFETKGKIVGDAVNGWRIKRV